MHWDISRDSFDRGANVTAVLLQQGRLIVDADWNEQTAVFQFLLRSLTADLIGWHGGPGVLPGEGVHNGQGAFALHSPKVDEESVQYEVGPGRYYINGLQIEVADPKPHPIERRPSGSFVLVYVDAWEWPLSDSQRPDLADPALGGFDTAGRTAIRFKLRNLRPTADQLEGDGKPWADRDAFLRAIGAPQRQASAGGDALPRLKARVAPATQSESPSFHASAPAGFQGPENQLYRVEVHRSGGFGLGGRSVDSAGATFKWSRDNGCVGYAIADSRAIAKGWVTLSQWWRDQGRAIEIGDVVELLDEEDDDPRPHSPLVLVDRVDRNQQRIYFKKFACADDPLPPRATHVRRWDHAPDKDVTTDGALAIPRDNQGIGKAPPSNSPWLPLEDGIEVQFIGAADGDAPFRAGDYWLIPARAATQRILWPVDQTQQPQSLPARYIEHFQAPIALVLLGDRESVTTIDLRCKIESLSRPALNKDEINALLNPAPADPIADPPGRA